MKNIIKDKNFKFHNIIKIKYHYNLNLELYENIIIKILFEK